MRRPRDVFNVEEMRKSVHVSIVAVALFVPGIAAAQPGHCWPCSQAHRFLADIQKPTSPSPLHPPATRPSSTRSA